MGFLPLRSGWASRSRRSLISRCHWVVPRRQPGNEAASTPTAAIATAAPPKLNSRVNRMPLRVKATMPRTQPPKNRSSDLMSSPVWKVKPTPAVMHVAKISTMATVTALILLRSSQRLGYGRNRPQIGHGWEPRVEYNSRARASCSAAGACAGLSEPPTVPHVSQVNW